MLMPMLGWPVVARQFADADISELAIDLPGTSVPEDPAEFVRWHEDSGAAVAYVVNRPSDVRPGSVGV